MRFLDEKAQKTVWLLNGLIVKNSIDLGGFKIKYCDRAISLNRKIDFFRI